MQILTFRRFAVAICVLMQNLKIVNMAAVRYFGFVVRMLGTTQEVLLVVFVTVQNLVHHRHQSVGQFF